MTIEESEIEELAKVPKRTRTDEGTVSEREMHELLMADRYNASKAALKPPYGLRIAVTRPGGTV